MQTNVGTSPDEKDVSSQSVPFKPYRDLTAPDVVPALGDEDVPQLAADTIRDVVDRAGKLGSYAIARSRHSAEAYLSGTRSVPVEALTAVSNALEALASSSEHPEIPDATKSSHDRALETLGAAIESLDVALGASKSESKK